MQKKFICRTEAELNAPAEFISGKCMNVPVFLYGDLGSGKTAFVRTFASKLGIEGVCSPTFTLINIYEGGGKTVMHCDLYRIHSRESAEELNLYEGIEKYDYTFIEWPEAIEHMFDNSDHISMYFRHIEEGREVEVIC